MQQQQQQQQHLMSNSCLMIERMAKKEANLKLL